MAIHRPLTLADTWTIRETSPEHAQAARFETIFSLGNGALGMRGNFEEGFPGGVVGTYLNGFYEETPIIYGEIAYGYARNRQVMLNVADGKSIRLRIGSEPFDLSTGTLLSYERLLDMQRGLLQRSVRWRSPAGAVVALETRRLVCLFEPHTAAIQWEARLLEGTASLTVESSIEGSVTNRASGTDPRVGAHFDHPPLSTARREAQDTRGLLLQKTRNTKLALACAMEHVLEGARPALVRADSDSTDRVSILFQTDSAPGAGIRFTKYLAYCSSRQDASIPCDQRARDAVSASSQRGFAALMDEQRKELDRFWHGADVEIDGDLLLQQGLRFNLFSLLQSAGRDGRTSIAAKGLSGEGYEGHYFWDTEIYVLPFFTWTRPEIARALLRFRIGILDKARARAQEMNQRGALFPWRTIGGEETSPYYPAGTAQYHIDADIAHALRTYLEATGDRALLGDGGAELLFETARLWADLGWYNPRKGGAFCINEVTGPDEYTALVNNNLYTNLMARENLELAVETARRMRSETPAELDRVARAIGLEEAEVEAWERAAGAMYVPFDAGTGVHLQDDAFLDRPRWDFEHTPEGHFPLMLHYHPLVIYRHQALKQPDVVLAQVLLGHRFSLAEKKRNFDFYDPLTTGDSSLSPCIQSVAAAELGYLDQASSYFARTARMDLDDVNGNVADGLHTAAMAGTWISVVYGFAGLRDCSLRGPEGCLSFSPRLPPHWSRLRFRLKVRDSLLQVTVTRGAAVYLVLEGSPLVIRHWGHPLALKPGVQAEASVRPRLECIVFDLDGVLTDTAELHFRAWKRLCDEVGIPFDRTVNEELKGIGRLESLRIILRHAGSRRTEEEASALAHRKNDYYGQLIGALTPKDLLPGVEALLASLRREGIRVALASASRNAPAILERLGIRGSMDHVVDPAVVVKGKPDPEIFIRAAEALGLPPRNCVGVEDARAGVQAIRAAGMFAVGIGRGLEEAHWVLAGPAELSLDELKARFEAPWETVGALSSSPEGQTWKAP
jgi:beta-phosphoglucomutase